MRENAMTEMTDLLGTCAAILTTSSFLPQVIKTWKSRSAADFSWSWIASFAAGLLLWLIYGVALGAWPLMLANGLTLLLVLMIAYIKFRGATQAS